MNGKRSSTKRTRHINIRYFDVTDKVRSRDVVVVYHPTKEMVAGYLTKPLHGTPIRTNPNTIMGLDKLCIGQYKA